MQTRGQNPCSVRSHTEGERQKYDALVPLPSDLQP
jgi:hypothetical protein